MRQEFPVLSKSKPGSKKGLLVDPVSSEILLTLYRTQGRNLDARNIAIANQLSNTTTLKRLIAFQELGLVQYQQVGRNYFWTLNTEHELWPAIKKLIYAERD